MRKINEERHYAWLGPWRGRGREGRGLSGHLWGLVTGYPLALVAVAFMWAGLPAVSSANGNVSFVPGSYTITPSANGSSVTVEYAGIRNITSDVVSGSLAIEVWYSQTPYSGVGSISGYKVASTNLPIGSCSNSTLEPNAECDQITGTFPFTTPPPGTYYMTLLVTEHSSTCTSSDKFCIDDSQPLVVKATGSPTVTITSAPSNNSGAGSGSGSGSGATTPAKVVSMSGDIGYQLDLVAGTAGISIANLTNNQASTTASIQLLLVLSSSAYVQGSAVQGYTVASARLPTDCDSSGGTYATLGPHIVCQNIDLKNLNVLVQPPAGSYHAIVLTELYNSNGCDGSGTADWCIADGFEVGLLNVKGPSTAGAIANALTGGGGGGSLDWLSLLLLGSVVGSQVRASRSGLKQGAIRARYRDLSQR